MHIFTMIFKHSRPKCLLMGSSCDKIIIILAYFRQSFSALVHQFVNKVHIWIKTSGKIYDKNSLFSVVEVRVILQSVKVEPAFIQILSHLLMPLLAHMWCSGKDLRFHKWILMRKLTHQLHRHILFQTNKNNIKAIHIEKNKFREQKIF